MASCYIPGMGKTQHSSGFTMLEMSIVLVIISLLVGGIILGQGLIRQYEIRKNLTRIDQFRTAVNSFKSQFDGLPGDLRNAEEFWGNGADGTVNGNGNRLIEFLNDKESYEGYRAWQQLALAELLEGNYTGEETTGAAELVADVPANELGGGYALEHDAFGMKGQLVLLLGNPAASTVTMLMDGAFKPDIALDIDLKVDDGMPKSGVVFGAKGEHSADGSCILLDDDAWQYDITKTGKDCIMGFQM